MKKTIWIICLVVAVAVLLVSGYNIGKTLLSRRQNKVFYSDVIDECFIEDTAKDSAGEVPESRENTPGITDQTDEIRQTEPKENGDGGQEHTAPENIRIDFERLRVICPDAIAWIYSPGTVINYPVVQVGDNDYYLEHMADGTRNEGGAIFADYRNKRDFSDYNTLIYGHRMNNGTMFGPLLYYKDQGYYDEHRVMYLYTESKSYKLELVCGFETTDASNVYLVPANVKQTRDVVSEGIRSSTFKSNVTVDENDRLVTLSTCTELEYGDIHRYVIIAKLTELHTERYDNNYEIQ